VLVSFHYDKGVVAAIKKLPPWAEYWDADSKVWRIHPGYAKRLVVTLRDLGYTVIEVTTNSASREAAKRNPRKTSKCITKVVAPGTEPPGDEQAG
jgi:hypothetical protein